MANPHQNILDLLADYITRAYAVRKEFLGEELDANETVVELYDKMKQFRNGLDRLETILNDCLRLKAKVEIMKSVRQGEVEDAEVKVSQTSGKPDKYQAARDRNIDINAKTIVERKALRQISEVVIEAHATVEVVRNMHRGLDSHRRDIETALRAYSVASSLER